MRKIFDWIAVSKLVWIVTFLFTVGIMAYAGVWTEHTPVESPTIIE